MRVAPRVARRAGACLAVLTTWLTAAPIAAAQAAPGARPTVAAMPPATPGMIGRLERLSAPLPADHAIAVRFDGAVEVEAHLARPHAVTRQRSSRRIVMAAPFRVRQDWTTWSEGDTARSTESLLIADGRVLRRDDERSPWTELRGRDADEAVWAVWAAAPALTYARALATREQGLLATGVGGVRVRYAWPEPLGRATLDLDMQDSPYQLELAGTDPRRGVVARGALYFGVTSLEGYPWPDSVSVVAYPTGLSYRLYERRAAFEPRVPLAELAAPADIRPAPAPADTTPVIAVLAPHVWAVDLPDADTRSLALEFADHLVLLETSSDVTRGERLRAAIRERISSKPVRFVSFSHHHPDYTGGLRPFIADSVTVVCAASNTQFVNEIAHWSFAMEPDRLWRRRPGGMTPAFDTLIAGRWRHADALNEVIALDIGAASQHTDAYVVFWLPRAKLLFEGDLGFFTAQDGTLRASRRAAGLVAALDAAKIAPEELVQSWPVKGNPLRLPMRRLRELIAARR